MHPGCSDVCYYLLNLARQDASHDQDMWNKDVTHWHGGRFENQRR
jgi:hypothetical protein